MKKLIIVIFYFFILVSDSYSQIKPYGSNEEFFGPFYDIYSKNYLSVKAAGKGYTGIAADNDLSGTILNPASLTQNNKFHIYGEYIYKSDIPYLYKENENSYFQELNPSMLAGISYKINNDVIIAALYENNNGFSIEQGHTDETGNPNGEYSYQNMSISSVSIPVVYTATKDLKFGINLKYSFYSYETENTKEYAEYNASESFEKFVPDFGIIYKPLTGLSFGLTFTPEVSESVEYVSADTSFTYPYPNNFPMKFGFGVDYTFSKTPLTLSADYTYMNTSTDDDDSEKYDGYSGLELNSRNDFNFGMEYAINKNVIIRTGLFVVKDFRDLENSYFFSGISNPGSYSQTFGTLGATVYIDMVNLNLSVIDSHIFSSGHVTQTQVDFGAGYIF